MKFEIKRGSHPNLVNYPNDDIALAKSFSKKIQSEFGEFLKTVVLFGSSARKKHRHPKGDIDVLVVVDDLTIKMTREVIEAYRLIIERI